MHPVVGIMLLLAAGGLAWLVQVDRQSPLALSLVELDGRLPVPLYGILGAAGVVVLGVALLERLGRGDGRGTVGPVRRAPGASAAVPPGASLRERVLAEARFLPLEAGATLQVDQQVGVPLTLVLDQVPPGRGKRAVERFGGLLARLPTPPRVAVVYQDCPPSTGARHTEVLGALSVHLPRGTFRVTSHLDRVDVVFLQPDLAWRAW